MADYSGVMPTKPKRERVVMGPPSGRQGGISKASQLRVSTRPSAAGATAIKPKPARKSNAYSRVTGTGGTSIGIGPAGRQYARNKE
jgi:hypothetical protein